MQPCSSCGRDGDLRPRRSAIDDRTYDCCIVCAEHHAEPLAAVVRSVNNAGWHALPYEIRQSIRIYDLEDYIRIPVWAYRMSHRQLTLVQEKQEDQELLTSMKQRLEPPQAILKKPTKPKKPKASAEPKKSVWSKRLNLFAWFG